MCIEIKISDKNLYFLCSINNVDVTCIYYFVYNLKTWPYTMTTPYWSDFVPNSTFYWLLSGFHRTYATGVACRQGTLTPPDTWSRPFGTCICSTCWDQSFSKLVVILLDYALRISLGTFSILLEWAHKIHNKVFCHCLSYFIFDIYEHTEPTDNTISKL